MDLRDGWEAHARRARDLEIDPATGRLLDLAAAPNHCGLGLGQRVPAAYLGQEAYQGT